MPISFAYSEFKCVCPAENLSYYAHLDRMGLIYL